MSKRKEPSAEEIEAVEKNTLREACRECAPRLRGLRDLILEETALSFERIGFVFRRLAVILRGESDGRV